MDDNLQGSIINLIIDEDGWSRMRYFGGQLKEAANQYRFTTMHFKIMENNWTSQRPKESANVHLPKWPKIFSFIATVSSASTK